MKYDLSCIIGKNDISFFRKYHLTLRRKMKDDLSQKNTRKYDIFFKCFEKMVLSKETTLGHDLSCIIWKDGIFSLKTYFFLGREARGDLFQEIYGNIKFSVHTHGCYKRGALPPCQNISRIILSLKNTPEGD